MTKSLMLLLLVIPAPLVGISNLGEFLNAPLFLDTQIESPATNSNSSKSSVLKAGDTLKFQMFVPAAAGKPTFGFNIEFALPGKDITNYFSEPSGTSWDGSPLTPSPGQPLITALLLAAPTVPSGGYLATVELIAQQDLAEGDVLIITSATMADPSTDNDPLDVSNAVILFTDAVEPVDGDFDLDGDVDFVDFLNFAGNFGYRGPVPTPAVSEPTIVTVRDTVQIATIETLIVATTDTVIVTQIDTLFVTNTRTITKLDTVYLTRIDTLYLPLSEIPPPTVENPPPSDSSIASISLDANLDEGYNNGQDIKTGSAGETITLEIYGHSGLKGAPGYRVVIAFPPGLQFRNFQAKGVFRSAVVVPSVQSENSVIVTVASGGTISADSGRMGLVEFISTVNEVTGNIVLQSAEIREGQAIINNGTITLSPNGASPDDSNIAAPTNLQATLNQMLLQQVYFVSLSWTAPSSFDSFLIQRAEVTAGGSSTNLTVTTLELAQPGTTYTDTNIQSNTTYVYRVSTNLSGSISDPSTVAFVVVP